MNPILPRLIVSLFAIFQLGASAQEGAPSAQDKPAQDASYVLRPNDTIHLSVFGQPDLTKTTRILNTGEASFELIDAVKIGGLTVAAAEQLIRDLYAADYLVDPRLSLTVADYATELISVIGSVNAPGNIPIPASGELDLGSAMAIAGGPTPTADTSAIQLVRASGGTSTYSMTAVQGSAGRTPLRPGDRIIVNESRFVGKKVQILGQVRSPGAIPLPVDGKLDLVTAIAMAGGVTELGNPRKVSINRKGKPFMVDFRQMTERGDRPLMLQSDDIITVPERKW
jgi:polysaccharide export outer membrane protein